MSFSQNATLEVIKSNSQMTLSLAGNWTLANLAANPNVLKLLKASATKEAYWDLSRVSLLDSAASLIIWQHWREQWPTSLAIGPEHQRLIAQWQHKKPLAQKQQLSPLQAFNRLIYCTFANLGLQLLTVISMSGQLFLDLADLILHPGRIPWAEISTAIYESGVRALGITALVGFLIGIVLSYLSALQLKLFGAEVYIINILGLSVIRELGPLLAAILVAGRSGSAMTAQIGIMRVTEELDALSAMGISHSLRLILPRVVALTLVMPLLSLWTSAAALLGGMYSAQQALDIGFHQFFIKLPDVVPLMNLFIGIGKSAVFGAMIALLACHFGFRIKPNTESLGNETTTSVVVAITVVIMIDALFAILFMGIGMP